MGGSKFQLHVLGRRFAFLFAVCSHFDAKKIPINKPTIYEAKRAGKQAIASSPRVRWDEM